MRIALFTDIHACREALEACMEHAGGQSVDRYAFLGDHIGYGADPAWVMDTVMAQAARGAAVVLGNHDEAVLKGARKEMRPEARAVIEWTRDRLTAAHIRFLEGLPLKVQTGDILFVHANAWNPHGWEYITSVIDATRCFQATGSRFVFFGHVHTPILYHVGAGGRVAEFIPSADIEIPLGSRRWLANPGAVGQPRDGIPAAGYAIFDDQKGLITYYRVPFDIDAAAQKIQAAGLPEWFGTRLSMGL